MLRLLLVFICLCLPTSPLAARELSGTVSWIYDGDTLLIEKIGRVRLLGIDVPEDRDSARDRFYLNRFSIPRKKLRQIARQVKRFNIEKVKGKRVHLTLEAEEKDRHGRILAYLYLPDGRMLNRLLLEKGLATVFRRYPFRHKEDFLALEDSARQKQLGLWAQ